MNSKLTAVATMISAATFISTTKGGEKVKVQRLIGCLLVVLVAGSAEAQVKRQPFVGVSVVAPRVESAAPATTVHGGFAIIVPVAPRVFLRPVVTVAAVNPTPEGKKNFLSVSALTLVGFRVNPNLAVLTGGGVTWSLPKNQPATRMQTIAFSTATRITPHLGIFTPALITPKGVSVGTQIGVTW